MEFLTRPIKNVVRRELNRRGYYHVHSLRHQGDAFNDFETRARAIMARHNQQDVETISALEKKYQQPIFGEIEVYRLLELMAQVIDPTNTFLYCTSQLTHALQVVESMEQAGISDPDMLLVGLLHDVGKLTLLKGEAPELVEGGGKTPVGHNEEGIGLDSCVLTWDHGDVAYARLKPYLPDHVAWLIHYHSIVPECEPLMDERDRTYFERYFKPFKEFDITYLFCRLPSISLEKYRGLIEQTFPQPVLF